MAILEYELSVVGEQNVARALASIERRFVQHQARINRVLAMGNGKIRAPGAGSGSRASVTQEMRSTAAAQQRSVKLTEQQRKAVRDVAIEARQAQRIGLAAHKEKLRAVEREKRAEISKIRQVVNEQRNAQKHANKAFRQAMGTGVTSGIGAIGAVGKTGAAMLGVGGSVLAGAAVHESLSLDERVRRLIVSARGAGETSKLDPERLRSDFTKAGIESGIDPAAVAGSVQAYVTKTGDIETAINNYRTWATTAQGTGAAIEEVAAAAADLSTKMGIKSVEDMKQAMALLTFQGKKGAFEFKAMASEFPEITAAAASAGVTGMGGLRELGSLAQIARGAAGSDSETTTALVAMFRQLSAKSSDIQSGVQFGGRKVQVFEGGDPTKPMRNIVDLLTDVMEASRGNLVQLQDTFDIRGVKAINPLMQAYRNASDKTLKAGGSKKDAREAGKAAMVEMIDNFKNVSADFSEVQRDAKEVGKATSLQLSIAMMELKDAFSQELLPVVRDITPRIRELVPAIRTAASAAISLGQTLLDNPLMGLGAIVGAAITVEIAKAQIAQLLQTGVMTPLGALGFAVGGVVIALAAWKAYIEGKTEQGKQAARDAAARGDEVRRRAQEEFDATGQLSPETRKQLQALQTTEQGTIKAGQASIDQGNTVGSVTNEVLGFLGNDEADASIKRRRAIEGAATTSEYTQGAAETNRLLELDKMSQQYGPENFKAQEVGAAIGDAAVQKIKQSAINTGNAPSPVKP